MAWFSPAIKADDLRQPALARPSEDVLHQLESDAVALHVGSHQDVELGTARLGRLLNEVRDADNLTWRRAFAIDRRQGDLAIPITARKASSRETRKVLDHAEATQAKVFR